VAHQFFMFSSPRAIWENVLRPWVTTQGEAPLSGSTRVICASQSFALDSLKRATLADGLAVSGVQWLPVGGLRKVVADQLGMHWNPLGRENLEFLLKVRARALEGALAESVSVEAAEALQALDDLARSGLLHQPRGSGIRSHQTLEHLGRGLEETLSWMPEMEERLLVQAKREPPGPGSLVLYGWGAERFPEMKLLEAALHCFEEVLLLVPQPRHLLGADPDERWIEQLEILLNQECKVCAGSEIGGFHSGYVDAIAGSMQPDAMKVPTVVLGVDSADQVRRGLHWVGGGEPNLTDHEPVALIVPGEGDLLEELCRQMDLYEIKFHLEVPRTAHPGAFQTFHRFLVRYYLENCDVQQALTFLEWLIARGEPIWREMRFSEIQRSCEECFSHLQIRNFPRLMASEEAEKQIPSAVREAGIILGEWPRIISWAEGKGRWKEISDFFGFGTDYLEPVWSRLDCWMEGTELPARVFFEYLEALVAVTGRWQEEGHHQPYAHFIVTTPEQAAGRSWGSMIWFDSMEGGWPVRLRENAFWPDALREGARQQGQISLLSSRDRFMIKKRQILDLLECCRGPVCFAARVRDPAHPENATFPNEWTSEAMIFGTPEGESPFDRWHAEGPFEFLEQKEAERETLLFDREQFVRIHRERADSSVVVSDYRWKFGSGIGCPAIGASRLEKLLHLPASTALQLVFQASPRFRGFFERSEEQVVGISAHRQLAAYFSGRLGRVIGEGGELSAVEARLPGFWWRALADRATWVARACLRECEAQGAAWVIEGVEVNADEVRLEFHGGPLRIRGRLDLTARDANGGLHIIDFKTGKGGGVPTGNALKNKGEGLQFIGYWLLMGNQSPVSARSIHPGGKPHRPIGPDDLELARPHLEILALMMKEGIFPQRRKARDAYGHNAEVLPTTTVPIAESVLTEQWQQLIESLGNRP